MIEFERPRRSVPELNLTPLIDVSFILIIFIVLAATFSRVRTMEVELPSADAPTQGEPEALVVTVPAEGPVRVGERSVAIADVRAVLEEARTRHDAVLLVADRDAAVQRAVEVLGEAQRAGFVQVAIAARPPGAAP